MADPFVAEIRIFPFNFAPKGWAWCNGQLLPLSQNTALFSLLGTTYGGDGKSNFALPDLEGRAPMHPGQGPGLSLHDLGETGGSETVTLLESEIPAHSHPDVRLIAARPREPTGGRRNRAAFRYGRRHQSLQSGGGRSARLWRPRRLRRPGVTSLTTTCSRTLPFISISPFRASSHHVRKGSV